MGVSVPVVHAPVDFASTGLKQGAQIEFAGHTVPPPLVPSSRRVASGLPSYAQPQFIRLMPELATTSTFKLKKGDLQKEGFDPRAISDPLYMLDPQKDRYVPLTPALYDDVVQGRMRL